MQNDTCFTKNPPLVQGVYKKDGRLGDGHEEVTHSQVHDEKIRRSPQLLVAGTQDEQHITSLDLSDADFKQMSKLIIYHLTIDMDVTWLPFCPLIHSAKSTWDSDHLQTWGWFGSHELIGRRLYPSYGFFVFDYGSNMQSSMVEHSMWKRLRQTDLFNSCIDLSSSWEIAGLFSQYWTPAGYREDSGLSGQACDIRGLLPKQQRPVLSFFFFTNTAPTKRHHKVSDCLGPLSHSDTDWGSFFHHRLTTDRSFLWGSRERLVPSTRSKRRHFSDLHTPQHLHISASPPRQFHMWNRSKTRVRWRCESSASYFWRDLECWYLLPNDGSWTWG